jgi:deoxyribonuclease V
MNPIRMKPIFSVKKAHETQSRLSKKIVFTDQLPQKIRLIAGIDVAYAREISIGAATVLDYNSLKLEESQTATCKIHFPYVPTLLSFREIPPTVLSIKKLKKSPDVFLVDGQGFAHPYRCGFASHLGLVISKPTIGVAKSKLIGEVERSESENDIALLRHKGEVVGAMVKTKGGSIPVYVSVGHMVSLETAIEIVKHCARFNRVPEPILKAHEIATAEKRKINIAWATNSKL